MSLAEVQTCYLERGGVLIVKGVPRSGAAGYMELITRRGTMAHGFDAEVFEAKDRTHRTLASRIGLTSDPATKGIMTFIEASKKKSSEF